MTSLTIPPLFPRRIPIRIANNLIEESNALLVIGCKLGEIATSATLYRQKASAFIHLEIVAEEIGRTAEPEVALWGDARAGIQDLHMALANDAKAIVARREAYCANVALRITTWKETVKDRYTSNEVPVSMTRIMGELNRHMPADAPSPMAVSSLTGPGCSTTPSAPGAALLHHS